MRKKISMIVAILLISAVCLGVFVACEAKELGKFYSLQEAYDQGLLSVEDLEQIAEYQNDWKAEVEGRPKVEDLDKKIAKEIKESNAYYWNYLDNNSDLKAKASDMTLKGYYGTYAECVVIMIVWGYQLITHAHHDVEVGGVMFHYSTGLEIQVWIRNK